jgi:hypothetical protein
MKTGIMAVHSDDMLAGRPDDLTIHTYQIAGSDVTRKTQTSNLLQKVTQAQINIIKEQIVNEEEQSDE